MLYLIKFFVEISAPFCYPFSESRFAGGFLMKRYVGLDAGSVSVKLVELDAGGNKINSGYRKHRGHPLKAALELLSSIDLEGASLAVTGSAGRLIASVLGIEPLNEVVAQSYSVRRLYPHIKTVIELGGEDSKLIQIEKDSVEDFSMNSVCAAGTGSFLDQQAERLKLSIEEFSDLALKAGNPPHIAGRCSVFAKSDMIHLQQIATPVESIVAGLCFAVARNFKGSIMRGRKIKEPVAFQGGVAANKGMVRAFREVLGLKELFVPPDFVFMGAWGAALKARDEGIENTVDIGKLDEFLEAEKAFAAGHGPLVAEGDRFDERHLVPEASVQKPAARTPASKTKVYLGIDVGSISTNLVLMDDSGNVISKRYLMTAGRPIEAVMQGLREIREEMGDMVEIAGAGTTGSGRYMIADYVGADIVKNEITAQATGAAHFVPDVDTIFEIGGQDSKYISLRDGVIVDFEMNKACAAGTGSFLEEQADKLSISVKKEFARCSFTSCNPLRLGERCTVFMENSLMANLGKGAPKNDLLAGLAYSIVQNYINRVVAGKPVGEKILFQGGVAFNKAVVAAFEKYLGKQVVVPPHHDVTGAVGMAIIAKRHMDDTGRRTTFKGFGLSEIPYKLTSFQCKGCPNVCEINRVKIEGEDGFLFYGGRCEKYDIRRKPTDIPNLFAEREKLLWKGDCLSAHEVDKPDNNRIKLGIPYIFFFHDQLPFWSTLLWECGFDVEVSPRTNREVVGLGLESVVSEACFPVKVAHGHIRYLKEKGVDAIFLPSFINVNPEDSEYSLGQACPHTQTIPYVAGVAFEGLNLVTFPIDRSRGGQYLLRKLKDALKRFGVRDAALRSAMEKAQAAQREFESAIKALGRETLSSLRERTVVIVGRGYNSFDRGINLEIPEKLATLGVQSIPMDFLPMDEVSVKADWPDMYWRSGQRIMKAARLIGENPNLYPIFIGNFSCGPDSFILKYFKDEMARSGKPFLHIEIDEHSADAGAITRCEAFLDSIDGAIKKGRGKASSAFRTPAAFIRKERKRKVYLPRMCDHAFAVQAGFERAGVDAEVLPPSDARTLELGERHVSGKECYPFLVTTGDMLKKACSPEFRPEESAFFMPGGTGPCRFGQYNVFHKKVLEKVGLEEVPIFSPNQDSDFYRDLGMVGKEFAMTSWKGIVAIEMLTKCLHETRPFEQEPCSSDRLYDLHLDRIYQATRGTNGSIEGALDRMRRDFQALPKRQEKRPIIGIIGEIFVRSNSFSNEDLIRKVESLGGVAWLAPMEEWIFYVNLMGLRKAWIKRDRSAIVDNAIKRFLQTRIEHKFQKPFRGMLKTLHEPSTSQTLKMAAPYVHDSFEGETVLSIGKAVDLARRGASGIINAMPFGCMPGTIVTALLRGVSRDYNVPCISIPYDGTESATTMLQLEAFMDQAKSRCV
jgi:predicted CoA-substrate-specific enzyme activase